MKCKHCGDDIKPVKCLSDLRVPTKWIGRRGQCTKADMHEPEEPKASTHSYSDLGGFEKY